MEIRVNGEARRAAAGLTLGGLLAEMAIDHQTVAVELNRSVVRRRDLDAQRLAEGDAIEVVRFVGGG